MKRNLPEITLRQFNAAGQCIDHSSWVGGDAFDLHVVMFDVMLVGCVRFEVVTRMSASA